MTLLTWHDYKYYPYEKLLAEKEIASLFSVPDMKQGADGIEIHGSVDTNHGKRLVYFAEVVNGQSCFETLQSRLEYSVNSKKKFQATRYSVHGLHEYKGKFNPQVVKALLNIFSVSPGQRVIDPFCGSGTTLVECAHLGVLGHGFDINPFAVYMANAKIKALLTPIERLNSIANRLCRSFRNTRKLKAFKNSDPRSTYLKSWFDYDHYLLIEHVKHKILDMAGPDAPVFLMITSNLLRDYSLQDPKDLRIRRRKSPLPDVPFLDMLITAIKKLLAQISKAQEVLGHDLVSGNAEVYDVSKLQAGHVKHKFDAAITSPPYAMALPYVDTQRLSLVWLDLIKPNQILPLEATLIGARELRGVSKRELTKNLEDNVENLPDEQVEYCIHLLGAISENDGFRRKAVPILLYRYFSSMRDSFVGIHKVMKSKAPFALIVGHNKTVLGGNLFNIDTPMHLARLAENCQWNVDELMPLQTYRRYGYHVNNSVKAETLLILRRK